MRKYQKVAVVAAMLGSVSFLGAGVSQAHEGEGIKLDSKQNQSCSADYFSMVGSETASDTFAPVNGAGLQLNDMGKHTSVACNQIFGIGGK